MSQASSAGSWRTTLAGPSAIADSSHPTSLRTVLLGAATFVFRVLGSDCRFCAVAGFEGTLPTGKSQLEAFAILACTEDLEVADPMWEADICPVVLLSLQHLERLDWALLLVSERHVRLARARNGRPAPWGNKGKRMQVRRRSSKIC